MAKFTKIPTDIITMRDYFRYFMDQLSAIYMAKEAESIFYILLEDLLGISKADLYTKSIIPGRKESSILKKALLKLLDHMPIQYVTGKTIFYGCPIILNKSVLIPRPETEELVSLFINENKKKNPSVMDIGTGSGCLAIAIKKSIPGAKVYGTDVSEKAMVLARDNAKLNQVEVVIFRLNILSKKLRSKGMPFLDYIISNPPYVIESEKKHMDKNVTKYEPASALYVPDDHALMFYEAIADFGKMNLVRGGEIYVEINESLGEEIKNLFILSGYKNVKVLQDMSGKDRFGKAIW